MRARVRQTSSGSYQGPYLKLHGLANHTDVQWLQMGHHHKKDVSEYQSFCNESEVQLGPAFSELVNPNTQLI